MGDIFGGGGDDSAAQAAQIQAQAAQQAREAEQRRWEAEQARIAAEKKAEQEAIAAESRRSEAQLQQSRLEQAKQAEAQKTTGAAYADTSSQRAREIVAAQQRAGGLPGYEAMTKPGVATAGGYMGQSNLPVATAAPTLAQQLGFTSTPGGRRYSV